MRAISRLLADVKPTRFLEPNAPTGLCGLRTHPSPRSTLLYLYHSTLEKLEKLPKSSVYRQSTEALTRHRLEIIKGTKPNGWTAWQDKIQAILSDDVSGYDIKSYHLDGEIIVPKPFNELRLDLRPPKPQTEPMQPEGPRPWKPNQDVKLTGQDKKYDPKHELKKLVLDDEPPFTTEQYVRYAPVSLLLTRKEYLPWRVSSAQACSKRSSKLLKENTSLWMKWKRRKCKFACNREMRWCTS